MRMWLLAGVAALFTGSAFGAEPASPPTLAAYTIPAAPEHGFAPAQANTLITELQQLLVARGYYAGPADGHVTPALRTAVSVYQSDVGLRVTGLPDLAALNMLRYGPEIRATIQPLGTPAPAAATTAATPVPAAAAAATRAAGVPPFEKIEPYRPPAQLADADEAEDAPRCDAAPAVLKPPRRAARNEEPPLPKAAPQVKVVSQPLNTPR